MAQVDTLPQLMELLGHIRRLIDHDQDLRESQSRYEPWDLVLNWPRIRTDLRLTIAPQFMISRQYYAGSMKYNSLTCMPIVQRTQQMRTRTIA